VLIAFSVPCFDLQCSVSCGDGIQTRQVRCEQKISPYNIATVDDSLCRGLSSADHTHGAHQQQLQPRPESERQCNLGECPADVDTASGSGHRRTVIATDPTVFTQLLPAVRVSVDVGSSATLIPGSTVNIHCPVARGFARQKIVWLRPGDIPVAKNGRIKVSGAGSMRIRKSRPADAGIYTCIAGQDMASVEINFHSEDEAASMAQLRLMMAAEGSNRVCCMYVTQRL
jgi:hypothetical protein